jgi:hypothetical protein
MSRKLKKAIDIADFWDEEMNPVLEIVPKNRSVVCSKVTPDELCERKKKGGSSLWQKAS